MGSTQSTWGVWESVLLKQLIPLLLPLKASKDGRHPQEDAVPQVRDRQPLLHHPQLRGGDQGVQQEELDKNLRASTKMAADNEQKLDELSRKLGVQEDELKRAIERAELAENKLKSILEQTFAEMSGY